jgi:hypothetical protein
MANGTLAASQLEMLSQSGTGIMTIVPPATNTNQTLTLPDSTGTVSTMGVGTAVSASGTSVEFTSIPSWVKRITVMFSGVSLSGTDAIVLRLGDSGGLESTGYTGSIFVTYDGGPTNVVLFSVNFTLTSSGAGSAAGNTYSGQVVLSLLDLATNTWVINGIVSPATTSSAARFTNFSGSKSLSATLDRLSVSASGANTFDAGTINIMYEG